MRHKSTYKVYQGYSDHERSILNGLGDQVAEAFKRFRRRERARTRQGKRRDVKKYGPNGYGINVKGQTLQELDGDKPSHPTILTRPDHGRRFPRGRRKRSVQGPNSGDAIPPGFGTGSY